MSDKLIYSSGATTNNAYGNLTTTWAAWSSGTFATADETGFGTWSSTNSQWTAPSSDLPDGVLCIFHAEGEDSSNGRAVLNMRLANSSGTGTLCSSETGGYNRDNSEDRAITNGWAIIDTPGASSVWTLQGREVTDAAGSGDELVSGSVTFVPIYYSNIGMYSTTTSQSMTGTSPTRVSGWSADLESDTAAIELGATTTDVIDCKGDAHRYLVLGGMAMVMAGTARSQRVMQLRRDSTAAGQGVVYLRQANSSPIGTSIYDMFETVTASIGVDMAGSRGLGNSARLGGAENDGGAMSGIVGKICILELNDAAEVIRTHDSTGQQECALTGPVDLNFARDTDFNDAASFTVASNTAVNAEQAMDAIVLANVNIPRNTSGVTSGNRWTAYSHWLVNGTEQLRTKDGDYNRGSQSSTDTQGYSAHPAGVLTLAANDDLGVSVQELSGSEGGGGDIETEPFANNEGLGFIALNLDTLAAADGTITGTGSADGFVPTVEGVGERTIVSVVGSASSPVSEVSALGYLWPKAYLNATETLIGATELTVTAANSAGTSITFDDDVGAPTGSLFLGVENRNNSQVGWIAVSVSAGGVTHTGSGSADGLVPLVASVGERVITGSSSMDGYIATLAGVGERTIVDTDATPQATLITIAGVGERTVLGSGSADGLVATLAGVGERTITGVGSADGLVAIVSGVGLSIHEIPGSGSADGLLPTLTGVGERTVTGSGSADGFIATLSASGVIGRSGSGTPTAAVAEVAGVAERTIPANAQLYLGDRTNIIIQSQNYAISWGNHQSTDEQAQGIAPDGTNTANKLIADSVGGQGQIALLSPSRTFEPSTAYILTAYLKADTLDWGELQVQGMGALSIGAFFDLANGLDGASPRPDTTSTFIEDARITFPAAPAGWWRCGITFNSDAVDTAATPIIFAGEADGDDNVDRDGVSSILVWGADLKRGTARSRYIPTTTVPVTVTDIFPTVSGAGTVAVEHTGSGSADGLVPTLAGVGEREITGTGTSQTVISIVSASGIVGRKASGDLSAEPATLAAIGNLIRSGAGSADGLVPTLAGIGERVITGAGSADGIAVSVSGSGTISQIRRASGSLTGYVPVIAAIGERTITGSGDVDATLIAITGEATIIGDFRIIIGAQTAMNDSIVKTVLVQGL